MSVKTISRPPSKPAQDDFQLVLEAIKDLRRDQQLRAKRRRRRLLRWPEWLDKRVAVAVGVIVLALVADGVWRENQEFYATVTGVGGKVWTSADENRPVVPLEPRQRVADYSTIQTGEAGWAELSFPDGSVVSVDSNTTFQVRLLEYSRGGRWRSRSFYVTAGRIWARVGKNFGQDSRMRVYTPACVAAVRGTRFSVSVAPGGAIVRTVCGDGTVEVTGFTGQNAYVQRTGDTTCLPGGGPAMPTVAPDADLAGFRHGSLHTAIHPEPWYTELGLAVTQTLDAPLTILGVGKCSWVFGCTDFARRAAAQEALRMIRANLEGEAAYPRWVNPATLQELGISEQGAARRILKSFDCAALESYWSNGRSYSMTVRARDRKRTRYEMTSSSIREADEQS